MPFSLFKKEPNLKNIFNLAPFAYLVIEKDLSVKSYNDKFLAYINTNDPKKTNLSESLIKTIPRINEYIERGLKGESFEASLCTDLEKKKKLTWFHIKGVPVQDRDKITKLLLTLEDITNKKEYDFKLLEEKNKRNEELIKEQARFQASINSLNVGFMITDMQGEIVTINTPAKNMLVSKAPLTKLDEHTKFELSNMKCTMADITGQLEKVFDLKGQIQECLKTGRSFDVSELPFKNLILHIFINPIALLSKEKTVRIEIIGAVVLVEDVTEEKILEHSRSDFFSIASHELRTPLTAIKGNVEIIEKYYKDLVMDERFSTILDDIHQSTIRLITMVNDFLDLSRFEQGKIQFKTEVFEPTNLIKGVVQELQPIAMDRNLSLRFEGGLTKPVLVQADPDKVKQVLINLVGNAIKFTQQGGVSVFLEIVNKYLKFYVSDSGEGVAPENQKYIFRKFQLASDNILTRNTSRSTGVGLYISKLMVEGMRGEIRLEKSEVDKGSTFSFTLPIAGN